MTNTRDTFALTLHVFYELIGSHVGILCFHKVASRIVDGSTEAWANGQQTRSNTTDQILTGTSTHNGVVSAGNTRSVISGKHQNQLDEASRIDRKLALEPQHGNHITNTGTTGHKVGDRGHTVGGLLAAIIADRGHNASGTTNASLAIGITVVLWDLRRLHLFARFDQTSVLQLIKGLTNQCRKVLKTHWDTSTSLLQGSILGLS
mmetsp:Transcript_10202/g.25619  ORF Transcript_10202/g.25619 Transcript_10202/m.25619 type:complete len:205 (+) Transcript_10202:508-1122(+)